MPPEGKAHGFATTTRTTSFHISNIVNVKQSRKTPHNLKIAISKDIGTKTYELEAENPRIASDIVTIIKGLCVFVFSRGPPNKSSDNSVVHWSLKDATLPLGSKAAEQWTSRPAQPEQDSTTTARSLISSSDRYSYSRPHDMQ